MKLIACTMNRLGIALLLFSLIANNAELKAEENAAKVNAASQPFLHALFTDNMVIQRDRKVPVWGWAVPGQKVTVTMDRKVATATANAQGKWMARIGPFPAGGPYTMVISGPQEITLKNVLVGDVWICSGQSNMEMGIAGVDHGAEEIANANYPEIRLYTVPKRIAAKPESLVQSQWQVCTPANIGTGGWGGFTAVGYFFGRQLQQHLKVPIGLIHTSWGGTVAEAWTSAEALEKMADFRPAVEQLEQMAAARDQGATNLERMMKAWYEKNDPGSAPAAPWSNPILDVSAWKTMELPQTWESAGLPEYDGVVWFRKEFDLPDSWAGKELVLHLGPIDDRDSTWVNGTKVGGLDLWTQNRDYTVPKNLSKAGRNVIAIRVLDTGGNGGIYGKPAQMSLAIAGDDQTKPISLAGPWLYQASASLAKTSPVPQQMDNNPNVVTVLYNGMIAPLLPYAIRGAIWYQGESNAGRAQQYQTLLPTMIRDWRARFGVGNFPFFIVQLANFMDTKSEPADSAWAELREAQYLTTKALPKVGLAVAIDIGDAKDIHPKNKQEVGRRLALAAQVIAYGEKIEYSGPVFHSMDKLGNQLRLHFDHISGGLVAQGGSPLKGFAIAGEDGKYAWADAVIENNTVIVSSTKVENPVAVRYGWADNPVCNLYNQAGLPAVPFRSSGGVKSPR